MREVAPHGKDAVVSLVRILGEELIAVTRRRSRRDPDAFASTLERLEPLGYSHIALLLGSVWNVLEAQKPEVRTDLLTPAENDVLRLLADGLSPKEIAIRGDAASARYAPTPPDRLRSCSAMAGEKPLRSAAVWVFWTNQY